MHVHVGALPLAVHAAEVIIILFVLRYVSAKYPDTAVGKALAAIH